MTAANRVPDRKTATPEESALLAVGQELRQALAELQDAIDEVRRLSPALTQQVFLRHVLATLPAGMRAELPTPITTGWAEAVTRVKQASAAVSAVKQKGQRILKAMRLQARRERAAPRPSPRRR